MLHVSPEALTLQESGTDPVRNDGGKALNRQAYHEATDPVRMLVFVRQRECQITDYDSRSTWDRFLDAGSIPARSIRGISAVGSAQHSHC